MSQGEVHKKGCNVCAIIPARAGSKAVPRKYIKLLGGYPLIAFSIVAAKEYQKIGRVIVTTDSAEIADIAKWFGAEVPFLRPPEFAQDRSTNFDFRSHGLRWFDEYEKTSRMFLCSFCPLRHYENLQ